MRTLLTALIFCLTLSAHAKTFFFVNIDGVISSYTQKYISTALDKASAEDGVLVLKLDTPGGLLDSTREIVQLILESDTKVVTFVSPQGARAGSAGTFITLASHFAVMAEGSNIGAARPVSISGEDIKGDMRDKIENDTSAFIKSIAEKRGRNTELAVETVTESLSMTAKSALKGGIIDAVLNTDEAVMQAASKKFGFEGAGTKVVLSPTKIQKVAFFLSDPNILMLLLFIGVLAIALEFKMPGTFVFAAVGITAIVMFLMGINIIPVNFLSLMLILGGFALMIAEVFIPSFGLLTVASFAAISSGMYLLFSRKGNIGIQVSPYLIAATVTSLLAIVITIGRLIVRDILRKPSTGLSSLVGRQGRIIKWNNGKGKIYINGEIWNAESKDSFAKDDTATVTNAEGLKLTVKKEESEG